MTLKPASASPRLTEGDFARFSGLLLEKYGLSFGETRHGELEIAVMQAFATSIFANLDDYYEFLRSNEDGGAEMERLVNVATINETHFFRDAGQFDALQDHVLPELIRRRRSLNTLRFWSAGCSSGEEAYSLAILLHELLPDINEWSITILGTDINTNALDRARRASYSSWSFREERSLHLRDKYFTPNGSRWDLLPQVRRMVSFSLLNLAEPSFPSFDTNTQFIDLILCRNVLIYLSLEMNREVIHRMFDSLQPGGWLVTAPAEGSPDMFKHFQARPFKGAVLYQRLTQTAALRQEKLRPRFTGPLRLPPQPAAQPEPRPAEPRRIFAAAEVATQPLPSKEDQAALDESRDLIAFGHGEQVLPTLVRLAGIPAIQNQVYPVLAQVYANQGDWQEAERWCQQAITQDLLALDAWYTLALVYQHQGRLEKAVEAMRKVIYLDHNDILGHFGLANLYFEAGEYPKAIKYLDNALHLLENRPHDELVPRSGGITNARLRDAITRQQQHWNAIMLEQSLLTS